MKSRVYSSLAAVCATARPTTFAAALSAVFATALPGLANAASGTTRNNFV